MRRLGLFSWALVSGWVWLALTAPALAGTPNCIPFSEAAKYVGSHRCVSGKVMQVHPGEKGVHFVDFCADHARCPFSVVVFARDLRHVGDIRDLAGRQIQIRGDIREYDGHAEIILDRVGQLMGDAARIPPLPKEYDVEKRPKQTKTSRPKKSPAPPGVVWDTEQNAEPD